MLFSKRPRASEVHVPEYLHAGYRCPAHPRTNHAQPPVLLHSTVPEKPTPSSGKHRCTTTADFRLSSGAVSATPPEIVLPDDPYQIWYAEEESYRSLTFVGPRPTRSDLQCLPNLPADETNGQPLSIEDSLTNSRILREKFPDRYRLNTDPT
jgi:hypothetical protein